MATNTEFRNATGDITVAMVTEACCNCGVVFAMTKAFNNKRREDGANFYCPAGHQQHYTETEASRLKRELAAVEERLTQARNRIAAEEGWSRRLTDDLDTERKRHATTKGQLTKTRNRIEKGVCPDCNRHFVNVERHMATQHGAQG